MLQHLAQQKANLLLSQGSNFGPLATSGSVLLGSRECTSATIVTAHHTITCVAPSGVGTANSIFITIVGNMGTGSLAYNPPTVVSIAAPSEGSSLPLLLLF